MRVGTEGGAHHPFRSFPSPLLTHHNFPSIRNPSHHTRPPIRFLHTTHSTLPPILPKPSSTFPTRYSTTILFYPTSLLHPAPLPSFLTSPHPGAFLSPLLTLCQRHGFAPLLGGDESLAGGVGALGEVPGLSVALVSGVVEYEAAVPVLVGVDVNVVHFAHQVVIRPFLPRAKAHQLLNWWVEREGERREVSDGEEKGVCDGLYGVCTCVSPIRHTVGGKRNGFVIGK